MIYLRKNKQDAKYNEPNMQKDFYLQNEMILFDEFYNNYKKCLYPIKDEYINWVLYQLSDICTKCLIAKELIYPVRRIRFSYKRLHGIINMSAFISENEIQNSNKEFIIRFEKDMNECLKDFVKEVKKTLIVPENKRFFRALKKNDYEKYLKILISTFFYVGLWSNLRIKPVKVETFNISGENELTVYNFFDIKIGYINTSEQIERLINNTAEFLKDRIQESFEDYKRLFELVLDRNKQIEILNEKGLVFTGEKKEEMQNQFLGLHNNIHFQKIKDICPTFEKHIFILIQKGILKYSDNILLGVTEDTWRTYYYASFLEIYYGDFKKVIKQDYMMLFGINDERKLEKRADPSYSSFQSIQNILNN